MNQQSKFDSENQTFIFIENIISRMGKNSLYVKSFAITIVTLLSIFVGLKHFNKWFVLILLFPIFALLILDTHYLKTEREYRNLYNKNARAFENDGKLANDSIYSLKLEKSLRENCFKTIWSFFKTIWSWSIFPFYFSVSLFILFIWFIL